MVTPVTFDCVAWPVGYIVSVNNSRVGALQIGIRADPCGNSGVCGSDARTCRACAGTGRTDGCQVGKFLDWGLTDEGVGLLRGMDVRSWLRAQ